jgi:hypothetical protein
MVDDAVRLHEIPLDRAHDPREEAEAFQRLPESMKDELRDRWRDVEGSSDTMRALRSYSIKSYVLEMMAVFAFFELFAMLRHFWIFVPALVVGALTGYVAGKLRAGTSSYPWIAGVGYVLLSLTGAGSNIFAWVAIVSIASLLGYSHTLKRFDRTES